MAPENTSSIASRNTATTTTTTPSNSKQDRRQRINSPAKAESSHAVAQGDAVAPHGLHVRPQGREEDTSGRVPQEDDAHDDRQRSLVIEGRSNLSTVIPNKQEMRTLRRRLC